MAFVKVKDSIEGQIICVDPKDIVSILRHDKNEYELYFRHNGPNNFIVNQKDAIKLGWITGGAQ